MNMSLVSAGQNLRMEVIAFILHRDKLIWELSFRQFAKIFVGFKSDNFLRWYLALDDGPRDFHFVAICISLVCFAPFKFR